jgi:hypothetical protein
MAYLPLFPLPYLPLRSYYPSCFTIRFLVSLISHCLFSPLSFPCPLRSFSSVWPSAPIFLFYIPFALWDIWQFLKIFHHHSIIYALQSSPLTFDRFPHKYMLYDLSSILGPVSLQSDFFYLLDLQMHPNIEFKEGPRDLQCRTPNDRFSIGGALSRLDNGFREPFILLFQSLLTSGRLPSLALNYVRFSDNSVTRRATVNEPV